VGPLGVVIVMQLVVIVLGCFMDWIGICLLTMPIFVPIIIHLGFDPIWFGVLFSMNVQIGFLTPPFGGAAFYLKGVAPPDISLEEIFAALWPFIGLQLVGLALVMFFPQIALWLPAALH
jgi:TRAP-type mannitol/chloroaromatic compound transport system permease large subunit